MTTLATYVEMPTPRRAMDGGDESLPADLTVAFGAAEAPVAGSVPLHDFLATAGQLTHAERMVLVEQALLLLEGNYVHLPLKSAMHAVNPVQRLRLLRARLLRQTTATMDPERVFHAEMSAIFHSVRDLHTNYLLPAPVRRDDRLPAVPGGEVLRRRRRRDVPRHPARRRACRPRRSAPASRSRTGTACRSRARWR